MRLVVAVSISAVLLGAACTSTQRIDAGVGADGEGQGPADGPVETPSTSVVEPTTTSASSEVGTGDHVPPRVADPQPQTTTTRIFPSTVPDELPPASTSRRYSNDEWEEHPAAVFVPDPALSGSGYETDWIVVQEREPSDPDDGMEGCAVDPPPTLDGLRIEFVHESDTAEGEVLIGIDDAEWAQETVAIYIAVEDGSPVEVSSVDELTRWAYTIAAQG